MYNSMWKHKGLAVEQYSELWWPLPSNQTVQIPVLPLLLPTLSRQAPARVLLTNAIGANRTRLTLVQKQRRILFFDQRMEGCKLRLSSNRPNIFGTRDPCHIRQFFQPTRNRAQFGDDSSALHLLCTLFLLSLISSTSDHQALDSRGWGPPLWRTQSPHRPGAALLYRDLSSGEGRSSQRGAIEVNGSAPDHSAGSSVSAQGPLLPSWIELLCSRTGGGTVVWSAKYQYEASVRGPLWSSENRPSTKEK